MTNGQILSESNLYLSGQFAVSGICDDYAENKEQWATIGGLLKKGVSTGKIVCPYSVEHAIETSMKHERNALSQDINFADLTGRVQIRNEVDSTARHIVATIRNKRPDYHTYFEPFQGIVMNDNWKRTKLQENRNLLNDMTSDIFKTVNVFRGASTLLPRPEMRKTVFALIQRRYEADILERFFHLSTFGKFDSKTVTLAGITIPYWADLLFYKLVTEYRMTSEDASKGKKIIAEQGLRAFPSVFIRANLEASMTCNGKKETINDQIDTIRLVGALPAVDILLTDGGKANDIRDTKLDKVYKTEVYSGKRADLENFTNRLQSLL